MIKNNLKVYRVRASVYPTPHANAVKHTWLSSGRVPLYNYYMLKSYLNLSFSTQEELGKMAGETTTRKIISLIKENVPDNVPDKRREDIFALIKSNNEITISEIASRLKANEKTIKRDIDILKKEGKIRRVGPQTGGRGYWHILKK